MFIPTLRKGPGWVPTPSPEAVIGFMTLFDYAIGTATDDCRTTPWLRLRHLRAFPRVVRSCVYNGGNVLAIARIGRSCRSPLVKPHARLSHMPAKNSCRAGRSRTGRRWHAKRHEWGVAAHRVGGSRRCRRWREKSASRARTPVHTSCTVVRSSSHWQDGGRLGPLKQPWNAAKSTRSTSLSPSRSSQAQSPAA
jgi:hypothetical protein